MSAFKADQLASQRDIYPCNIILTWGYMPKKAWKKSFIYGWKSKLHLQVEQAKFCFKFFQLQNKTATPNCLEK